MKRRSFIKALVAGACTVGAFLLLDHYVSPFFEETLPRETGPKPTEIIQPMQGLMRKRRLGRTGLKVSVIGLGGGPNRKHWQVKVVKEALKMGVNYIDTARKYSTSEEIIGLALKNFEGEVYIATKTGSRNYRGAKRDMLESLRRLQRKKIDIIQMHAVGTGKALRKILNENDGAIRAAKEFREKGIVDFIGITGAHAPNDFKGKIISEREIKVCEAAIKTGEFDTVMLSYNVEFCEGRIVELIDLASDYDVGVICKKPLGRGLLVKEYGVKKLLQFVLENKKIHVTVPGMATINEVRENVPIGYFEAY